MADERNARSRAPDGDGSGLFAAEAAVEFHPSDSRQIIALAGEKQVFEQGGVQHGLTGPYFHRGEYNQTGQGRSQAGQNQAVAETIVLALDGRFESFTVGSDTEWEKVREVYRMGLKHGMKLAAISGVEGVFSDDDIVKVRELALKEINKTKTQ